MQWKSILKALVLKRKFAAYHFNGTDFFFDVEYAYNEYSPIYWIFCLLAIPWYFAKGGLSQWYTDVESLRHFRDYITYEIKGSFNSDVPEWKRPILLWSLTYINA